VDKFWDFISKARYPVVFLVLGAVFALVAASATFKGVGLELAPYSLAARLALGLLALALIGLGVFMILRGDRAAKVRPAIKYDVFLAAPMAGIETDEEYQAIRSLCLEVLALMRSHCGVATYYFVGEKLETKAQFESFDVAAEMDFDAIGASRDFVLIYPRKVASSVLAEAGFALARGIPLTLFARDADDLPYLLRQGGLPRDRYPEVHVRPYETPEKLKQIIRNDGANLFDGPKSDPKPPPTDD
jgi:hypothetical protein